MKVSISHTAANLSLITGEQSSHNTAAMMSNTRDWQQTNGCSGMDLRLALLNASGAVLARNVMIDGRLATAIHTLTTPGLRLQSHNLPLSTHQ